MYANKTFPRTYFTKGKTLERHRQEIFHIVLSRIVSIDLKNRRRNSRRKLPNDTADE